MTDNEIYKMPLYDGTNWSGYRMRMSGYAGKKKLLKILDGKISPATIAAGEETAAEKVVLLEAYETGNMELYSKLVETIKDDGDIVDIAIGDGRAVWLYLLSVHESNSRASVKQLVRHLGELRQGTRTVKDFLAEVAVTRNRIESALLATGVQIIDVLHSMAQIQGLDSRYDMLKNHLFLDDTLTPTACKAKIIEATERMDMEQREVPQMALKVTSPPVSANSVLTCSYCKKTDQSEPRCFVAHPELRRPRKQTVSSIKVPDGSGNSNVWTVTSVKPSCVMKSSVQSSDSDIIVFDIDSGAEKTFKCGDGKGLDNYDPTHSITVVVADQCEVHTRGKGCITGKLNEIHVAQTFGSNLLSCHQLYSEGKATLFHPIHGILIADATAMHVQCDSILCQGYVEDNMFKVKVRMNPQQLPATSAASIIPQVNQSTVLLPEVPAMPSDKDYAKCDLQLRRLRYSSPQRILETAKYRLLNNIDLSVRVTTDMFRIDECDAYQLAKSTPNNRIETCRCTKQKPPHSS